MRRPESFRLLRKLAKHEFTFGVEGISARLRAYLGKPATAGDLIRIAGSLADGGLRQMKLFFILTGLEEDRDLAELELLLKSLRAKVPACRIIASFMPLFHAPFTPLQFAPFRALSAEMERALSSAVRHAGAEFRWSAFPDEIALMNRLCRAGRTATPALVHFSIRRDLRYYRRLDPEPDPGTGARLAGRCRGKEPPFRLSLERSPGRGGCPGPVAVVSNRPAGNCRPLRNRFPPAAARAAAAGPVAGRLGKAG